MNRRLVSFLIVFAGASQGAELELALPPSDHWVEQADPLPLPSAKATSRFWHSRENPELGLRVVTDPSRKLDYFPGVVKEMAERLKHPQEGLPATIIEATALKVQGIAVAKLISVEGATKTLAYHLPGDEGDQVVSLIGPQWEPSTEEELTAVVLAAKGLRASALAGSGTTMDIGLGLLGVVGVMFVITVGLLFWGLRRKGARP